MEFSLHFPMKVTRDRVLRSQGPEPLMTALDKQSSVLRQGQLWVQDFLDTEFCLCVNQHHFGGDSHCHSSARFSENVVVAGISYQNKNVRSFIILLSGESLTCQNRTNFFCWKNKTKQKEAFCSVFFSEHPKTLSFKHLVLVLKSKALS